MGAFFVELSIVIILAFLVSFLMQKIKQPLLIGYILTGVLAGPIFLGVLSSTEGYETFAHLGVALLLFIVGLHLNLKLIKDMGTVAFIAGMVQIAVTVSLSFLINKSLGVALVPAFLISIGLAFSSTIVIVKLLTDKKQINKLSGKLTMGVLIVEDLVAVLMLMILNSVASSVGENIIKELITIFFQGVVALAIVILISRTILDKVMEKIASSQEFLYLFIIAWCFGVSALFSALGFSVEIGALVAGVALASSPFHYEISSKVKPLRDFFIVMFFILLGSQMIPVAEGFENNHPLEEELGIITTPFALIENFTTAIAYISENFSEILMPALILSLFVIIAKPLVIFIVLNLLGFNSKTNFQVGMNLSQISEFSLIMLLLAQQTGLVTSKEVSLVTLVAIITITISTYLITKSNKIYGKMQWLLKILEFRKTKKEDMDERVKQNDVLVFGYNKVGYKILETIHAQGKRYTVIDYNPHVIEDLMERGIPSLYGDASDTTLINEFDLENTEMLISTLSDFSTNILLLKEFKARNPHAKAILTSDDVSEALELYSQGADYVIVPHLMGGHHASTVIHKHHNEIEDLFSHKLEQINELKKHRDLDNRKLKKKKKTI